MLHQLLTYSALIYTYVHLIIYISDHICSSKIKIKMHTQQIPAKWIHIAWDIFRAPPHSATTRFVCSFGQHDIHRELANRNLRLKLGDIPKGSCSMFQGWDHLVLWQSWQEDKLSRPSCHLQPAKDLRGSCCWVLSLLHKMNNDKYNPITGVKV